MSFPPENTLGIFIGADELCFASIKNLEIHGCYTFFSLGDNSDSLTLNIGVSLLSITNICMVVR